MINEEFFSNFECEDDSEHKTIYENTDLLTGILQAQKQAESEMSKASEECIIAQDEELSSNVDQLDSSLTEISKTFTQTKDPWSRRCMRYTGVLTVLVCILTLMFLTRGNNSLESPGDLKVQEASMNFTLPDKTPEPPKPEIYRKKISEIHIGERSVGHNPKEIEETESDSEIFQKVKHNGYTFLYLKESQTLSVIELLRPENWLESEYIQIRRGSDDKILTESELEQFDLAKEFSRDDEDYDLEVWIELPEMGVVGWTTLVAIDDNVKIQEGPGNVVTGTFAHISDNVIDLQLESQDKPIGCTSNHPFWSVDRQEFIEAGQLLSGEQVLLYSGETKRVVQKLPRPGPQVVYNLEVYAEHVYHVTQDGVLVHNTCNSKILARNMKRAGIYNPKMGKVRFAAHHIVCAKDTPDAAKILQQYNIGINSFWNGVYLPMKKNTSFGTAHIGRHAQAYKEYINSVFANGKFSNQREVIRKLQEIRQQLASGNLFLN